MVEWVLFHLLFFGAGWFIGKQFSKMNGKIVAIMLITFMFFFVCTASTNWLLQNFMLILGYAKGYNLYSKSLELFEEIKINILLLSTKFEKLPLKTPSFPFNGAEKDRIKKEAERQRHYFKQNKRHYRANRQKEEELKKKERDIKNKEDEILRKKKHAEEEIQKKKEKFESWMKKQTQQTKTNYPTTLQEAFELLGTKPGLTISEYKKIWRDENQKYHPDKLKTLGIRLQKQAEEETKAINIAMEIITKHLPS